MNLPDINNVKNISKKIALLDAVFEQEWEFRYYSFDSQWSESEEMGSLRDGSGNHFFIIFKDKKCFIKVIDKKIDNKVKIFKKINNFPDEIKNELFAFLNEPAFYIEELSFLYWNIDGNWNNAGNGENEWLDIFTDPVSKYQKFALEYFEVEISSEKILKVFNENISMELLTQLNPGVDTDLLNEDIMEIGLKIL